MKGKLIGLAELDDGRVFESNRYEIYAYRGTFAKTMTEARMKLAVRGLEILWRHDRKLGGRHVTFYGVDKERIRK